MLLFERTTHGDELASTGQQPLAMRRQSVATVYVCGPCHLVVRAASLVLQGHSWEPDAFPTSPPGRLQVEQ